MMPDTTTSASRRTLSTFRTHLVLTSLTATVAFALVIALSIFVPLAAHLSRARVDVEIAPGLAEHFLFVHSALWPLVFLSLCACVVSATLLFQRMRSPLVRFMECFDRIREGGLPEPLVIRVTDYLHEETDALNQMIAALEREAQRRRELAAQFGELLAELSASATEPFLIERLNALVKSGFHDPARAEQHDASDG